MAMLVLFTGVGCGAQGERAPDAHAAEGTSDADPAHGDAEEEHAAEGHDAAAEDGHGGVNYDEPDLSFHPKLFFWSLGVFLLFVFVAGKFAWTPLIEGLDAREARVNRALHDAEAARVGAEQLLAEHDARMEQVYDEVKEIVAAARQAAEAEKAKIIAEADAEAAVMRDQAISDIQAAHRQAVEDLDARIDGQVAVATEHVLGHSG